MFKKVFVSLVAAAVAMLFVFGGTNIAKASPSYDQEVTETAKRYVDTKFLWGGNTPKGFDASGFTQYVFKTSAAKKKLARTSLDQYKGGKAVAKNQVKLGDLVFFNTSGSGVSFVGIYLGNNEFIGATSKGVKVQSMKSDYWKKRYVGAKRYL